MAKNMYVVHKKNIYILKNLREKRAFKLKANEMIMGERMKQKKIFEQVHKMLLYLQERYKLSLRKLGKIR